MTQNKDGNRNSEIIIKIFIGYFIANVWLFALKSSRKNLMSFIKLVLEELLWM